MIKLTPSQQRFVASFPTWFTSSNTIAILEGDGGCGKTTVLKLALEAQPLNRFKQKALILAETNEAVNVLRSKLGMEYEHIKTVCSAFNLVHGVDHEGNDGLKQHKEPEFEGITLLVIDEASMLASSRLKMILTLCRELGIYVLLIGDRDQLPPVEGNLAEFDQCISPAFLEQWYLDNGFSIPVTYNLTEPCRNTSDIYEFCTGVKKLLRPKAFGLVPDKYQRGFNFLKQYLTSAEGNEAFLTGKAVILAHTNKRVAELNSLVRTELFGKASQDTWLVGDRIIFRQPTKCFDRPVTDGNNYFESLLKQRGEILTTNTKAIIKKVGYKTVCSLTVAELYIHSNHFVKGHQDGYILVPIDRKEALIEWNKKNLSARFEHDTSLRQKKYQLRNAFCTVFNIGITQGSEEDTRRDTKHSYAMTVHCSQGSSIQTVFVDEKDVTSVKNKTFRKKLQYVAYSRAVSMLVRLI